MNVPLNESALLKEVLPVQIGRFSQGLLILIPAFDHFVEVLSEEQLKFFVENFESFRIHLNLAASLPMAYAHQPPLAIHSGLGSAQICLLPPNTRFTCEEQQEKENMSAHHL